MPARKLVEKAKLMEYSPTISCSKYLSVSLISDQLSSVAQSASAGSLWLPDRNSSATLRTTTTVDSFHRSYLSFCLIAVILTEIFQKFHELSFEKPKNIIRDDDFLPWSPSNNVVWGLIGGETQSDRLLLYLQFDHQAISDAPSGSDKRQ